MKSWHRLLAHCVCVCFFTVVSSADSLVLQVELQPLAAQVRRLIETLDYLGAPLSRADKQALERATTQPDAANAARQIQDILDSYCLYEIHINPESRVKVTQAKAKPELVENGWRTFLVKIHNEAGVTAELKAESVNALKVYSRGKSGFATNPRPEQTIKPSDVRDRWLDLSMYTKPPMKPQLSGLNLEYRIIQLYSRDAGKREAKVSFNVGQGSQDIGFRNDVDILFTCKPSTEVTFNVRDEKGQATTASFIIRDKQGHIYPSQAKRLAPDFHFHPQIYRSHGEKVKLPAGEYQIEFTRGPEYLVKTQTVNVLAGKPQTLGFKLERWIDLAKLGWISGDHHIHAAGCLHYETPSQGVQPDDMMRHILGEDLKIGSVLTWGPCYYYQKQFFEAKDNKLSQPDYLMRYDLEVSGFPSSHTGHLVMLRLKEQDYPNTKVIEDWPTWDLPILKWGKAQGAVVGFAHSGWGLEIKPGALPSYEVPKFDGIGANEYIVDVTHDAVDFISTVDTPAPWELNIWYHTLNVGFRTRISGETDFPCIYGERVGLGRSYVKLDGKLNYEAWVEGIKMGRNYVSDGKSHLLDFAVNGVQMGTNNSEVKLSQPGRVRVTAKVAARLDEQLNPDLRTGTDETAGRRAARQMSEVEAIQQGRLDQKPYWELERARIGQSREVPVELIVNGEAVARQTIVADGKMQDLQFDIPIAKSSWVALRVFPSSHTNPIFILVNNQPIRASQKSAEWCLKAVDQCWTQKAPKISARERGEAEKAYDHARQTYQRILMESK
ncbi:MAG: CehA/McbA family metallohydrolase [Blastocatellia bacterium]|nr:CehA/McbA family metallohydrolase [Blastocatellia bacterium]